MPRSILEDNGVTPATLEEVLTTSDFVFVVAAVTSRKQGFPRGGSLCRDEERAAFILLSRADVVDFDALIGGCRLRYNRLRRADVYPEEPLRRPSGSQPQGFLRSATAPVRSTAPSRKWVIVVLEDMDLMDRGLPPMRCKPPSARRCRGCARSRLRRTDPGKPVADDRHVVIGELVAVRHGPWPRHRRRLRQADVAAPRRNGRNRPSRRK